MKVFYPITLDVKKTNVQKIIEANKGEGLDRKLIITLVSGNKKIFLDNELQRAVLVATKPDGTHIYNSAKIKDGKVHVYLTTQTTAAVGQVDCQIRIISIDQGNVAGGNIYSAKFSIDVEDSLYDDTEIESTNEFSELVELTQRVEKQVTVYPGEGEPTEDILDYDDIKIGDFYYDQTNTVYYYAKVVDEIVVWEQIINKSQFDNALDLKADKSTTYTKTEVDTEIANKTNKVFTAVLNQDGTLNTETANYTGIKKNDLIKGDVNDNKFWGVDYVGGSFIQVTSLKNVFVLTTTPPASTTGVKLYNQKDVVISGNTIYKCASVTASETTPIVYSYTWETVISADNYYIKSQVYTKTETDTLLSAKQNNLTAGSGIDITSDTISFKVMNAPNNLLKAISGYYYVGQEDIGYSEGVRESLQNSSFNYALAPKAIVSEYAPPRDDTEYTDRVLEVGQIWEYTEDADYNGTYFLWNKTENGGHYGYHWLPIADASQVQEKLTAGSNVSISNNVISAIDTTYSAGDGIDIADNTIGVDIASGSALQITSGELDVDLSGKQDTIDSSHKLSADNVDDSESINKFVSAAEKTAIGKEPKYELIKTIDISEFSEPVSQIIISEDEDDNAFACDDFLIDTIGVITGADNSRYAQTLYCGASNQLKLLRSNTLGTTAKSVTTEFNRRSIDAWSYNMFGDYKEYGGGKLDRSAYTDKVSKIHLTTDSTFTSGIIKVYGKVKY